MDMLFIETIDNLRILTPYLLVSTAASIVMLVVLYVLSGNVWISDRRFRTVGILYSLDTVSAVSFCSSWLQNITAVQMVCTLKAISPGVFIYYLVPAIVFVVITRPVSGIFVRLFWTIVQLLGIVAVVLVRGYVDDIYAYPVLVAVYFVLAVIVVLFSVYLFFMHMSFVSESKRQRIEKSRSETN